MFDRFASLWISFNAWGTYESHFYQDRNMINWAKTNSSLVTNFSVLIKDNAPFRRDVEILKNMCPIRVNKVGRGSRDVTISDIHNFGEVLEVIYTIRCNFFHGKKSPDDSRDRTLVELAFRILSEVFRPKIAELST
jgi:hypothetical protein